MYHREFEIASTLVNAARNLRLSSLLHFLQDVATEGADYLGIGPKTTFPMGYLWVISRMEIDVIRMPKYQETIDIYTYPGKTLGFFYPRHFVVYDRKGEIIIRAASVWALINKDTRNVEMRNKFPSLIGESHDGELPRPARLAALKDDPILEKRTVRYSDVDLNGHLNNIKYVEMIDDLESGEVHASRALKHVLLNYEKELREGDELVLRGKTGLETVISAFHLDAPAFEAKIEYVPWTQDR